MQRQDAVIQAFANAPEDDEPWTAEDDAAIAESDTEFAAGNTLSHEEMLRKYGWPPLKAAGPSATTEGPCLEGGSEG